MPYFIEFAYSSIWWLIIALFYFTLIGWSLTFYEVYDPVALVDFLIFLYIIFFSIEWGICNFPLILCAFIDMIFQCEDSEIVEILSQKIAFSTTTRDCNTILSRWFGIQKLVLYCKTSSDRKIKIRTTTDVLYESIENEELFYLSHFKITYGKHSRILQTFCAVEQ